MRKGDGGLDDVLDKGRALYETSIDTVQGWVREILSDLPRVIGFTSTFQQNVAALSVAKELRRHVPREDLTILFGGANCESEMGRTMAEAFPFIDHVVGGEAEQVIVNLVRSAVTPGHAAAPRFISGVAVDDMDALPLPDFHDYFAAVKEISWSGAPNIVAESSRGCWWGARSHCTFCGLNGGTMRFRSKSPDRFVEEIRAISERYEPSFYMMTDNILDLTYLKTVFPQLVGIDHEARFFYEVKANLKKDQVELLAAGGVIHLQPGIESLSTPILRLMAKGTSRLQNIQLLKWCKEFDIALSWNFLYGFPGEPIAEYAELAELLPALVHLPAPTGAGRIRLDRFSPYWSTPERYGLHNVRPFFTYAYAYPVLTDEQRTRLSYFFEFEYDDDRNPDTYAEPLLTATRQWRDAPTAPQLELGRDDEGSFVIDTRAIRDETRVRIGEPERALLAAFDTVHDRRHAFAAARAATDCDAADLDAITEAFLVRRWLIAEGSQLLSIVVDPTERDRVLRRKFALRLEYFGLGAFDESSSARESHPHALKETDVNLSIHPALIIQPLPS